MTTTMATTMGAQALDDGMEPWLEAVGLGDWVDVFNDELGLDHIDVTTEDNPLFFCEVLRLTACCHQASIGMHQTHVARPAWRHQHPHDWQLRRGQQPPTGGPG